MTERILVLDAAVFLAAMPKAHAAPARSAAKPVAGAKLGRHAMVARQQNSQRRFAFGYSGAANGSQ